jgi:hypothetical protein
MSEGRTVKLQIQQVLKKTVKIPEIKIHTTTRRNTQRNIERKKERNRQNHM